MDCICLYPIYVNVDNKSCVQYNGLMLFMECNKIKCQLHLLFGRV